MKILFLISMLALTACASRQPETNLVQVAEQDVYWQRSDLVKKRNSLASAKNELARSKIQADIDRLNKEISDLQAQIEVLEARIASAEKVRAGRSTTTSTSTPSGTNIGPRGGCYTITKSGKKNYGGC